MSHNWDDRNYQSEILTLVVDVEGIETLVSDTEKYLMQDVLGGRQNLLPQEVLSYGIDVGYVEYVEYVGYVGYVVCVVWKAAHNQQSCMIASIVTVRKVDKDYKVTDALNRLVVLMDTCLSDGDDDDDAAAADAAGVDVGVGFDVDDDDYYYYYYYYYYQDYEDGGDGDAVDVVGMDYACSQSSHALLVPHMAAVDILCQEMDWYTLHEAV